MPQERPWVQDPPGTKLTFIEIGETMKKDEIITRLEACLAQIAGSESG